MKYIRNILLFLLAFIVAFLLYLTFRKDVTHTTDELKARFETEHSQYLDWRGNKIHYTDQGDGLPIIFIHGFGGSFVNWNSAIDLMPRNYRLISVDLPGFGISDAPVLNEREAIIDMYTDAIQELIHFIDLDSITLIGNSMGGFVSWETALRSPDKINRLILVNSAGYDMDAIGGTFIQLSRTKAFDWAFRKGLPYRLALIAARGSVAGQPDRQRVKTFHHLLNRKETINTLAMIGGSGEAADTNRISAIHAQTLIIWGEKDRVIPVEHARRFHRNIGGSQLIIYPHVAHVPMIEDADRFVRDVLEFLN